MPRSEHPEFCYVYVLLSTKTNKLYTGYTTDLRKRYAEHQNGFNRSTKSGRPWRLVFYEAYLNQVDARRREGYLKSTQGSRVLRSMLREYLTSKND